jgi:hypothetical protein
MTATSSPAKPLSFFISYGFICGAKHGKELVKLLQSAGFRQAGDRSSADIIIAHSAGTWKISDRSPKLVLYIAVPLLQKYPLFTFIRSGLQDIKAFCRPENMKRGIVFSAKATYYSLRNPLRNFGLMKIGSKGRPQRVARTRTVFISNQNDPWQRSAQIDSYLANEDWAFIAMPGCHDDLWLNPDHYVEIINHYARLLA